MRPVVIRYSNVDKIILGRQLGLPEVHIHVKPRYDGVTPVPVTLYTFRPLALMRALNARIRRSVEPAEP